MLDSIFNLESGDNQSLYINEVRYEEIVITSANEISQSTWTDEIKATLRALLKRGINLFSFRTVSKIGAKPKADSLNSIVKFIL